jgi:hypothetical protein
VVIFDGHNNNVLDDGGSKVHARYPLTKKMQEQQQQQPKTTTKSINNVTVK